MISGKNGQTFFTTSLLPELVGKWYTRPVMNSSNSDANATSQPIEDATNQSDATATSGSKDFDLYCYCHGPEEGVMIACDSIECKIEWFHHKCLKLNSIPRSKWYSPDCCKLPQFLKRKKKK